MQVIADVNDKKYWLHYSVSNFGNLVQMYAALQKAPSPVRFLFRAHVKERRKASGLDKLTKMSHWFSTAIIDIYCGDNIGSPNRLTYLGSNVGVQMQKWMLSVTIRDPTTLC